jgi:alpha-L-fucosidase
MKLTTLLLTAVLAVPSLLEAAAGPNVSEAYPPRMSWWLEARYGMFIHWDMSSIAGTEISWSRKGSKPLDITGDPAGYVEDPAYDSLYKNFNPTKFNAREWVALAKESGMKYIVFTTKHHGGFCMWDTKYTDYNIMNTPFRRDVVRELAEACRKVKMPLGFYYSPRDWHHPDYGIGDNRKYVDYMNGQVRELLTNYGKVDVLWWDSYGRGDLTHFWRVGETFDLVQKLQPGILMNNRLAELGAYNQQPRPWMGDFDTPEQRLGEFQNTRPWESCMCVVDAAGGGWSYRPDGKVKTYAACMKTLLGCATGDGNLLLDVGPDSTGVIPADQAEALRKVGVWLKKYGESIYGTRGGPFRNGAWGGSTFKGNKVYLHVSQWNGQQLELPPLKAKITSFACLTAKTPDLKVEQTTQGIALSLPIARQDPIDTLICFTLSAPASAEMTDGKPLSTVQALPAK